MLYAARKYVADVIRTVKPAYIITHWSHSIHKDHSTTSLIVQDAVLLASLDGHVVLRTRVEGADADAVGVAAATDLFDGRGGRALLAAEDFVAEHDARLLYRECRFVGTRGCQRVEHVDDAHDLRQQRHAVADETVGVSAAVEMLVVVAHDRSDRLQQAQFGA